MKVVLVSGILALAMPATSAFAQQPAQTTAEARLAVMEREAAAVLQVLIRDKIAEKAPCIFRDEWDTRPVTMDLARQHLGLNLFVDVVAPYTLPSPSKVIDPAGTMPDRFCNATRAESQWKELLADFQAGRSPLSSANARRPGFQRVHFSKPVFDNEFKIAVLVATFRFDALWKGKKSLPEAWGYSFVYRKQAADWVEIEARADFTMN